MILDDKSIKKYLKKDMTDRIFKILPLYEEGNKTLPTYVESLMFEVKGFSNVYGNVGSNEYYSIISTLSSLCDIVKLKEDKHSIVKREVFKCLDKIATISDMLEGV